GPGPLRRLRVHPARGGGRARARLRRGRLPAPGEHHSGLRGRGGELAGAARPGRAGRGRLGPRRALQLRPHRRRLADGPGLRRPAAGEVRAPEGRLEPRQVPALVPHAGLHAGPGHVPLHHVAAVSGGAFGRRSGGSASASVKVAFIGTHGVGTTSLCYDLASVLKRQGVHVDIVKEVARLSPLPINRQTSLDAQTWILMTQGAEAILCAAHPHVVVCDRSVLDNYAYMMLACGRQKPIERFVAYWMKTYDLL